ncbi:MAG: hypothetical protein R2706_11490 [Acidimicrobiales bacterium]
MVLFGHGRQPLSKKGRDPWRRAVGPENRRQRVAALPLVVAGRHQRIADGLHPAEHALDSVNIEDRVTHRCGEVPGMDQDIAADSNAPTAPTRRWVPAIGCANTTSADADRQLDR